MKTVCIVLNYNDADTTIQQLDRIKDYACFDAIIVVDGGSTDDSGIRLKNYISGNMILIEAKVNRGYGAGNNLGIRYAKEILSADYALIANPDTIFTDGCIMELKKVIFSHRELAVIAPVMTTTEREEEMLIPGSRMSNLNAPVAAPLRPWIMDLIESGPIGRRLLGRYANYNEAYYRNKTCVYVDTVPGSLLLIDIEKFEEVGGFDEEVFLYSEEAILGHEFKQLGYRSAVLLREYYIHKHSTSISKSYKTAIKRQKIREKSTLHYYAYYLGISDFQMIITRLYYIGVNIEIWLASKMGIQ